METMLLIVSILLIAIVLLQSNKASDAGQIISGGNEPFNFNIRSSFLRNSINHIFTKIKSLTIKRLFFKLIMFYNVYRGKYE